MSSIDTTGMSEGKKAALRSRNRRGKASTAIPLSRARSSWASSTWTSSILVPKRRPTVMLEAVSS